MLPKVSWHNEKDKEESKGQYCQQECLACKHFCGAALLHTSHSNEAECVLDSGAATVLRLLTQLLLLLQWAVQSSMSVRPFQNGLLHVFTSKIMWVLPAMKRTLRICGAKRVRFYMGTYGADTLKPTVRLAYIRHNSTTFSSFVDLR